MRQESMEKKFGERFEEEMRKESLEGPDKSLSVFLEKHKSRFDKRRTQERYTKAFNEVMSKYDLPVSPDKMDSKEKFKDITIKVKGIEEIEKEKGISDYAENRIKKLYEEGITDFVELRKRMTLQPKSQEIMKYFVFKHLSPYEFFENYLPYYWRAEKGKILSIIDRLEYVAVAREMEEIKEKLAKEKRQPKKK